MQTHLTPYAADLQFLEDHVACLQAERNRLTAALSRDPDSEGGNG